MRLKSHQQHQQQQSTNQRLKTHVPIVIILVVVEFCLLATKVVAAVATSHPAAIQIGDPKQRIPRQVAEDDNKARDDCDCDTLDGASYHKPHFAKGRSVIVDLFEWKFVDVAEECRTFLGPKGYGGVQLSPVLEHTVIKTTTVKHPWWQRYETVSYRFSSRSGDESEFWSMSRICNDNGVRIYLTVQFNHMAAPLHLLLNDTKDKTDYNVNTLLESNVNIFNLSYPNVPYTSQHFHRPCAVGNSQSTHEIRNCQLNGHPDLDLGLPSVQKNIVEMLNKFIDMGVAGFHIHSAKYIWPNDLKNIYEQLKDLNKDFSFANNSRPFMYHDIFDLGLDSISKTEYATYGAVTEYLYAAEISTILRGKAPLSSLINWGPAMGFLSHQDSVIFIDSPETQRGLPHELGKNRVVTHRHRQKYTMANALMMAHPYGGIKRIMSSYDYSDNNINEGPPTEEGDEDLIRSPKLNDQLQCTAASGWVCEHRWSMMVSLVALANYFSVAEQREESVSHFQTNGPNHIAFCRGHKAFVAMNNDVENDFIKEVFTCLEPGVYCDVVSGGLKEGGNECHGRHLEVNEEGYAKLNLLVAEYMDMQSQLEADEERYVVENAGVLIVYVGSKIGSEVKKIWEESSEGNDKPIKEDEDLENPSLSEDKVDDDGGGEADGQISGTKKVDDTAKEGGGEDATRDNDGGHTEDETILEDKVQANSSADNLDDADPSESDNDGVAAVEKEAGDGGHETADEPAENEHDDEVNPHKEKSSDDPSEVQEKSDDIEVPAEEFTGNGEEVDETPVVSQNQDKTPDEMQENEEDDGNPNKEENQDENQESIIDVGDSINKEGPGVAANYEIPSDGQGKDNDADANADGDGTGEEMENNEETQKDDIPEVSAPLNEPEIPDESENMAAPLNSEEESEVAEIADLEEEVTNAEEADKKMDDAPEVPNSDQDSDIPNTDENLAAPVNVEEENEVVEVAYIDIEPEAPNASQEKGENVEIKEEEISVTDKEKDLKLSAINEYANSNNEAKESKEKEGSEETGVDTSAAVSSGTNGEATPNNGEGEESVNSPHEHNGDNIDTEVTSFQIEKPFPNYGEADKTPLEKYNATIYEIVYNVTEPLPYSGNNSKAAVRADDVQSAKLFPPARRQQPNGDQMLKSHSYLLWLIVVKILVFDFNLKKIQFHLMLKLTPVA